MDGIKSLVKRHPLAMYFVLTYALTWILAPLLTISLLLGVVGLLMPAVAAITVFAVTEGTSGLKSLLQRLKLWFVAFLLFTTGASVLFAWLYLPPQGSLLIVTLFHGAVNSLGLVNNALDPASRWWLTGIVYVVAALIVSVVASLNLRRQPAVRGEAVPSRETAAVS
jgi:hypothetical protein